MYESRKNMGDVCEDVSNAIEKRKDVLSEEQQHDRDSEPRQNEAQLHIPNPTELGIEDYVIHELQKAFPQEDVSFKIYRSSIIPELVVEMECCYGMKNLSVGFNYFELFNIVSSINDYIVSVCIQKFEKALKGVTK